MKARSDALAHRVRQGLLASVIAAITLTPLSGPEAVVAQDDAEPLDLAAMILRPDDLAAVGLDDHGRNFGILTDDPAAAADFLGMWRGEEVVEDLTDALEGADPDRAYVLFSDKTVTPGDATSGAASRVTSSVFAFKDEAAAEDGFAVLADAWTTDRLEEIEPETDVGDERIVVAGSVQAREGSRYSRVEVLFRSNQLVSGVAVDVFDAPAPEPATVEALAAVQLDRIETVQNEGGPGLSHRILRLEVPGRNSLFDLYDVQDGEVFTGIGETAEDTEAFQAGFERLGIIELYRVEQQLLGDPFVVAVEPRAYVASVVWRFEDEDAASDYLQDAGDRLESEGPENLKEIKDVPDLGDEIAAFTYTSSRGEGITYRAYRIYVRVGAEVFKLVVNSTEDFEGEAVENLAAHQAACLTGEASCLSPEAIPAGLPGAEDEGSRPAR